MITFNVLQTRFSKQKTNNVMLTLYLHVLTLRNCIHVLTAHLYSYWFQQHVHIFAWNCAELFKNEICTLQRSFVEIWKRRKYAVSRQPTISQRWEHCSLWYWLEFTVLFQHGAHGSPEGSNLDSLGPLILLNKPGIVRLQPVPCDTCRHCRVRWGTVLLEDIRGLSWLKQHNVAIFRYTSTKCGNKVYLLLLISRKKF